MRIQVQPPQTASAVPPRATWYTQGETALIAAPPIVSASASPFVHWPDAVGYREAVQNPQTSLAPPELRSGAVSLDRRGLPVAYSGRFAVVFRVVDTGGTQWAVRCFTAPPQDEVISRPDRYRLIASHVSELGDLFVPFKYFERGIRVGSDWFPIIAMRWAAGETLGKFTDRNLNNPQVLRDLAGTLSALLKRLEDAGIAHGDWQHDNLLVSQTGKRITLVDYDGMYVPEFGGLVADEIGHANYQHPARTPLDFGAGMDRFACLSMQCALLALAHEPSLWNRFSDGESLLFKKIDFQEPDISPVFRALREIADTKCDELLSESLTRLTEACRLAPDATPEPVVAPLEDAFAKATVADWDSLPTTATVLLKATAKGEIETVLTAQTGVKWWRDGAPVALPDPVAAKQASAAASAKWFAGTQTPAVMGGAGLAQAYRPVETWAFIERVFNDETLSAERKHFALSRGGMAILAAFTVLFVLSLFGRGGSFPFYLFFWVFNIGSLGYANWPRKKIHDELEAEIAKMEKLMNERREKIAARRFTSVAGGGLQPLGAGGFGTLHDYVSDKLAKTSMNGVLQVKGITISTLKTLKSNGVQTALHLQGRLSIPGVPAHEMAALQQWCRDLEMRAADEYRHSGAKNAPAQNTAEIARWEQEAAEFERERDRLLREKAQFPDVGFWNVYWRKLFGLPENVSAPVQTP